MNDSRQERRKRRTRQVLLDAALALFSKEGIYSPSIEEITQSADLGKGTFYKHFSSREELIAALVRQGFDHLLERMNLAIAGGERQEEIVARILAAHADFFHEHPEYLLLFHQARGWLKLPGEASSPLRSEFERYVGRMGALLPLKRAAKGQPQKRSQMARVLAGFISGVLSFHYILSGGFEGAPDLIKDMRVMAEIIAV